MPEATMNWQLLRSAGAPILAFVLAYHCFRPLLRIVLNHVLLTRLSGLRSNLKRFGSWAVITGATDGIGKAYAQLLAKQGLNIALVSRSPERLRDTANELKEKYKVETKCVACDFSETDVYDKVESQLKDLDVACLVNNVGMGMPHPNFFTGSNEFDIGLYCKMLNINCLSMMRVTRIVAVGMLDRAKGGVVINVASSSGLFPTPLLAVYSATKAFAVHFSKAIAVELSEESAARKSANPIVVQTVSPYFVATKLSSIRRPSFFAPSPLSFANEALNLLGVESDTLGCFAHALQHYAIGLVPKCLANRIMYSVMDSTRRRALKKAEAKAKAN